VRFAAGAGNEPLTVKVPVRVTVESSLRLLTEKVWTSALLVRYWRLPVPTL
jgi:hypothetical protein